MNKILVLCVGNSCRSQMAEGYLKFYARGKAQVYSAGLEDHGLHPKAVEVMAEDSIDISEQTSKLYTNFKHENFDYLITVCDISNIDIPNTIKWSKSYNFNIENPTKAEGDDEIVLNKFRSTREQVKKSILHFIGKELIHQNQEEVSTI